LLVFFSQFLSSSPIIFFEGIGVHVWDFERGIEREREMRKDEKSKIYLEQTRVFQPLSVYR
jgi:hypothetical protein